MMTGLTELQMAMLGGAAIGIGIALGWNIWGWIERKWGKR